jgi:hypothetical protein
MTIVKEFSIPMQKDYYEVLVFKTRKEMYEYRKEMNKDGYNRIIKYNFDAICSVLPIIHNKYGLFGKVLFWEKTAENINVVSHEFAHACLYWWVARVNKPFFKIVKDNPLTYDIERKADEQFATLYGNTLNEYWDKWLKVSKTIYTDKLGR